MSNKKKGSKIVKKGHIHRDRSQNILIILTAILLTFSGFFFLATKKEKQEFCANSISCIKNLTGIPEEETKGIFLNKNTISQKIEDISNKTNVLSWKSDTSKHIFINLSNQKLYAYEGNNLVYEFPVSTGKWSKTPVGEFKMWIKLRATRMQGGNAEAGTYYNLPNVPYTMYIYNDNIPKTKGYGIHGAYWHNNFGHPMSHGCINMKPEDAKTIYYWSDPPPSKYVTYVDDKNSTPITIFGETPTE